MSHDLEAIPPQERKWGMAMHLAALAGLLMPLGLVLGPLLIWLLKKNDSAFLNRQGKLAINFQLTILIGSFILGMLSLVIRPLMALAFMAGIAGLVFAIMAGIAVNKGKEFNYPFSFNLIK